MDSPPKILIIDDEPDNFDVIDALLDQESYDLTYASDGFQALQLLETFLPDVILLDVMMPDMNGIEFCKCFKANPRWQYIPIIMVTALTTKEDLADCIAAGADDFISKPVSGLELRARVRSMLRIRQQYEAQQTLLMLREDLSHMIVHDLRTPLASIMLSAELLQLPDLPPEDQIRRAKQISLASQQLQAMVDNILLIAKLESGKFTLQLTEVDLADLCESALSGLEAIALQKKIELVRDFPLQGCLIQVDANLFRRIIDNLLSNAIKFSPFRCQVILRSDCLPSGRNRIQVIDSGPGISEAAQRTIFERYEVGTLAKNVSQIGLGLAFCKMAIEAHGGTITVESNQPKGSIFSIEF